MGEESLRQGGMLAGLAGGLLAALDGSTVPLALYAMGQAFGLRLSQLQLVLVVYLLAVTALVLPAGALVDRWGPRRAYAAGLWVFLAGAVAAALAPGLHAVLLARLIQGVGAAVVLAAHQALLSLAIPEKRQAAGFGLLHSAVAIGLLAGPLAGGPLIGVLGWRAGFLPQVTVSLVALWVLWTSPPVALADRRETGTPSLRDVRSVAFGHVLVGLLAAFLCFVAMAANMYLMPLFLQDGLGYRPGMAGVLLASVPAVILLVAPAAGAGADRVGIRLPTTTGLLLVAAGIFLMGRLHAEASAFTIVGTLLVYGLGAVLFQGPNNSSIVGGVPTFLAGRAAGALVVARNGGQLAGVALATAFWDVRGGSPSAYRDTFWLLAVIACAAALVAALRQPIRALSASAGVDREGT